MVTLFFNFADVIENQYLVYEIYINRKTKLMTMSRSWDFWRGFTLPSPAADAAWDILGGKLSQKLKL